MTQEEIALTHQQLRERLLTWILIGSLDRETAIANTIYHATGKRIRELPITTACLV